MSWDEEDEVRDLERDCKHLLVLVDRMDKREEDLFEALNRIMTFEDHDPERYRRFVQDSCRKALGRHCSVMLNALVTDIENGDIEPTPDILEGLKDVANLIKRRSE